MYSIFLVNKGIAKSQTAMRYLNALNSAGFLAKVKRGREYYFINSILLRILSTQ